MSIRWIRLFAILSLLLGLSVNSIAYLQYEPGVLTESADGSVSQPGEFTVVTTQESWKADGRLLVFNEAGELVFSENRYDEYWDVDPDPNEHRTVIYGVSDSRKASACPNDGDCVQNYIVRHNLSTHKREVVFDQLRRDTDKAWHDVDYDGNGTYLIADINQDAVWKVNVDTFDITYGWRLHNFYDQSDESGDVLGSAWTHLNDVERLEDGRIMVSPRNHDQVLFIKPGHGVQTDWTLGTNDEFDILYEQHNPDYIPEDRGGPAVLVADSQNNRIIEYQRQQGSWVQSWIYQDDQLKWPRDADRLPNGNTLITDTHGNRVIEVNRDGEIIWSVKVASSYDAERLGTGDESTGGQSAESLSLSSVTERTAADAESEGLLDALAERIVPTKVLNAFRFATPGWFSYLEFFTGSLAIVGLLVWAVSEAYVSGWNVRWPVSRGREAE